jgi:hypothetical protein
MAQAAHTKALTVRFPVGQIRALETLAYFENVSVAEQIRQAVTEHIEARRQDDTYIARIHDDLDQRRRMIEEFTQHGEVIFSPAEEPTSVTDTDTSPRIAATSELRR